MTSNYSSLITPVTDTYSGFIAASRLTHRPKLNAFTLSSQSPVLSESSLELSARSTALHKSLTANWMAPSTSSHADRAAGVEHPQNAYSRHVRVALSEPAACICEKVRTVRRSEEPG